MVARDASPASTPKPAEPLRHAAADPGERRRNCHQRSADSGGGKRHPGGVVVRQIRLGLDERPGMLAGHVDERRLEQEEREREAHREHDPATLP